MEIRNINVADLNEIKCLQPEGWTDIIYYFDFYIKSEICYPICAVKNGRIVGVACAIINEITGWLAHIIVHKDYRRQGIGYKLTESLMHILNQKKCKTQLLIASANGEKLYPKLGFIKDCTYKFFQGKMSKFKPQFKISSFKKQYEKNLLELDYCITGEKRNLLTTEIINNSQLILDESTNKIIAYYIKGFADGAIISKNKEAGIELLKLKHSNVERKSTIPENNISAIGFFKKYGFLNYDSCSRMYFGEKLNWQPENIYCRIGGFYG